MSVRRLAERAAGKLRVHAGEQGVGGEGARQISSWPTGVGGASRCCGALKSRAATGCRRPAIETVAAMLDMPNIRVLEVATFYTMFNLTPVGRHYVQLCGTTPCMLCGAEDLKAVCRKRIGEQGHVTPDGLFSWTEVECLGACCNAPMVQINEDYYEDLTPENFAKLLDDLAAGRPVRTGSQIGRVSSEPVGGLTSLIDALWRRRSPRAERRGARERSTAVFSDEAAAHAHAEAEVAHIQQRLRACRRTRRPSRRRTRSALGPPPSKPRAAAVLTICSGSRASVPSMRNA